MVNYGFANRIALTTGVPMQEGQPFMMANTTADAVSDCKSRQVMTLDNNDYTEVTQNDF